MYTSTPTAIMLGLRADVVASVLRRRRSPKFVDVARRLPRSYVLTRRKHALRSASSQIARRIGIANAPGD